MRSTVGILAVHGAEDVKLITDDSHVGRTLELQQQKREFTMSRNLPQAIKTLSLAFTLSAASLTTYAADPVTDAMLMANAPYRMALYKTNGNSQTEALDALTQAQQAWSKLSEQFGAHPPRPL